MTKRRSVPGIGVVSRLGIRKDATKIADFGQEIRQEIRGQTAKDSKGAAPR